MLCALVLMLCGLCAAVSVHAIDLFGGGAKAKFLPVDQAFQTIPRLDDGQLSVDFVVVPKHYVYKDRVKLLLANGKTIKPTAFSLKANYVDDPEFGRVAVFEKNVTARFSLPKGVKQSDSIKLKWQGCAKAGLCYPPMTEAIALDKLSLTAQPTAKKKLTKTP